jgi:predicted 3-demethylubiquinone-9 3-methyltransferase (glyoxalase superfamily)
LYSFIYVNGKKTFSKKVLNRLSLEGIAIWYMDDGSLYNVKYKTSKNTYRYRTAQCMLNTYLSKEENEVIVKWFKDKYDIKWRIVKDKNFTRLQMGTKQARKFIALIKDYIHPSMMYKTEIKVGQEVSYNTLQPKLVEDIVQ